MKIAFRFLLASLVVSKADAIIFFLFATLVNKLAVLFRPFVAKNAVDIACTIVDNALGFEFEDCSCNFNGFALKGTLTGESECAFREPVCVLPNNTLCATNAGIFSSFPAGFFQVPNTTTTLYTRFDFTDAVGIFPGKNSFSVKVSFYERNGFELGKECSIEVPQFVETCTSCTVCDSGKDFRYDCSNIIFPEVNYSTATFPKYSNNTCRGLNFMPTNATQ